MLLISGGVSAGKFDLVEPALARHRRTFSLHRRPHPARQTPRLRRSRVLRFETVHEPSPKRRSFGPCVHPNLRPPRQPHLLRRHLSTLRRTHPRRPRRQSRNSSHASSSPAWLTRHRPQNQTRPHPVPPALCEFSPSVSELPQVATVPWHGSGDLTAFARSNCFLVIPEA